MEKDLREVILSVLPVMDVTKEVLLFLDHCDSCDTLLNVTEHLYYEAWDKQGCRFRYCDLCRCHCRFQYTPNQCLVIARNLASCGWEDKQENLVNGLCPNHQSLATGVFPVPTQCIHCHAPLPVRPFGNPFVDTLCDECMERIMKSVSSSRWLQWVIPFLLKILFLSFIIYKKIYNDRPIFPLTWTIQVKMTAVLVFWQWKPFDSHEANIQRLSEYPCLRQWIEEYNSPRNGLGVGVG